MNRMLGDPSAEVRDAFRRVQGRLEPALVGWVSELLSDLPVNDRTALQATLTRGKKVRGVLLCLVAEALGGGLDDALPRAAAVELVHAASLIHDDVIDRDAVRRDMPAVWTREGVHRAILIGDVLFASAIQKMSELDREDGLAVSRAIAAVARGACLEPVDLGPTREPLDPVLDPWARYEAIIRLKTAVLFEASCRMGAHVAGADASRSEAWGRYGMRLGEAYQIADDLQDLRAFAKDGRVAPHRVAPLLPALCGASSVDRDLLLDALMGGHRRVVLAVVRSTVPALEREIEERLAAAVSAVDGWTAEGLAFDLLRVAPRELIRLLDGESRQGIPSPR